MTRLYTVCINLDNEDMDPTTWEGGLPEAVCAGLSQVIYQINKSGKVELVCTDRETGEPVVICKIVEHNDPILKPSIITH